MRSHTRKITTLISTALALATAVAACNSPSGGGGGAAGGAAAGATATGAAGTTTTGATGATTTGAAGETTGTAGATTGAAGMTTTGAAGATAGAAGATTTGAAGAMGAAGAGGQGAAGAGGHPIVKGSLTFTKMTLHLLNYAEGIGIGDFNKDGAPDVHAGPFWWEGPAFTKKHQYFPPPASNAYTDKTLGDWADYEYDVDGDGWLDSINIMRPGTPSYWYKNPGKPMLDADISTWTQTELGTLVMEQSAFGDITGEGKPELIGAIEAKSGWFDITPSGPWTFNSIGVTGATVAYAWWHGIGFGDLDGDHKQDLIMDTAWYTRPAAGPRSGPWTSHAQQFKGDGVVPDQGPSQMFGYDVDGDGDEDVVTALDAHGYGVAWYENTGGGKFTRHLIVGGAGSTAMNAGMIAPFSQPHAMILADIDGDGIKDLVTGKSFYAHPPGMGDPDADGTPVFYVFKLVRGAAGVTFEPHLVDSTVGLGRQFTAGDLDGDGKIDIAVASKHGAFLFFQK